MELINDIIMGAFYAVTVVLEFIVNDIGILPTLAFLGVLVAGAFQIMIDRERHPDDIFGRHDNIAKRHRKALVQDLAREIRRQDHAARKSASE